MGKYIAVWDDSGVLTTFEAVDDKNARNDFWEAGRLAHSVDARLYSTPLFPSTKLDPDIGTLPMAWFEGEQQFPRVYNCADCGDDVNIDDPEVSLGEEMAWAGKCGKCLERQEANIPKEILDKMAEMDEKLNALLDEDFR